MFNSFFYITRRAKKTCTRDLALHLYSLAAKYSFALSVIQMHEIYGAKSMCGLGLTVQTYVDWRFRNHDVLLWS